MSMKLWKGRFTKAVNSSAELLNASLPFDCRLAAQDIRGSMAHVGMLGEQGIIPKEEALLIRRALANLLEEIQEKGIDLDPALEDIHMAIETHLIERLGPIGKRLHTARSRNDQVATDLRLWQKEAIQQLIHKLDVTLDLLKKRSDEEWFTLMPGFTHLQHAQPVSLGLHLDCWRSMLLRDRERFEQCLAGTDALPLGAGALAGTTFPIDRDRVARELEFSSVIQNSLDAVSDRDFVLDFLFAASMLMMHFSRICEELVLWSSQEFSYVEMDDAFSTGSSIMPQKKNPDMAELIRGKSGRVYGNLLGLLTVMKGLPLAYNKDMQEDKEGLFDSFDTLDLILDVFPEMLSSLQFRRDKLAESAEKGYVNATDVADYLVKKGMPFRDAHTIVGKLVASCIQLNLPLKDLSMSHWKNLSDLFEEDIIDAIDPYKRLQQTLKKQE